MSIASQERIDKKKCFSSLGGENILWLFKCSIWYLTLAFYLFGFCGFVGEVGVKTESRSIARSSLEL